MRIDFNVLWVEDQPGSVEAQIKAIAKRMEDEGFELVATMCESLDSLRAHISTDVFTDEVDLILVDWDLGSEIQGQNAITEIRERIPYKDVIFYSAQTAPQTLSEMAFNERLEGVYCIGRDGLVEEVTGVFESLVKKVLDLDHSRGIVMGATSDIDNMVNECLICMHAVLDEGDRQATLKEVLEFAQEQVNGLTKQLDAIQDATTMRAMIEARGIFTANDRLRILSRLLKKEIFKAHKPARPAVVGYIERIVPRRNELAHVILVPRGKFQKVGDTKGKPISADEMRELRRDILNLRDEFRKLRSALQGNSG